MSEPWIGVDLDGTLAAYDGWQGPSQIGAPIPAMTSRVRRWLAEGKQVRILTARVGDLNPEETHQAREAIAAWCKEHFGHTLPITATKDYAMVEMWDDRCVQVIPNTGQPLIEEVERLKALLRQAATYVPKYRVLHAQITTALAGVSS